MAWHDWHRCDRWSRVRPQNRCPMSSIFHLEEQRDADDDDDDDQDPPGVPPLLVPAKKQVPVRRPPTAVTLPLPGLPPPTLDVWPELQEELESFEEVRQTERVLMNEPLVEQPQELWYDPFQADPSPVAVDAAIADTAEYQFAKQTNQPAPNQVGGVWKETTDEIISGRGPSPSTNGTRTSPVTGFSGFEEHENVGPVAPQDDGYTYPVGTSPSRRSILAEVFGADEAIIWDWQDSVELAAAALLVVAVVVVARRLAPGIAVAGALPAVEEAVARVVTDWVDAPVIGGDFEEHPVDEVADILTGADVDDQFQEHEDRGLGGTGF